MLTERVVPFTARGGLRCNLINVRDRQVPPHEWPGPPGAWHRAWAHLSRPPLSPNFVEYLVSHRCAEREK